MGLFASLFCSFSRTSSLSLSRSLCCSVLFCPPGRSIYGRVLSFRGGGGGGGAGGGEEDLHLLTSILSVFCLFVLFFLVRF